MGTMRIGIEDVIARRGSGKTSDEKQDLHWYPLFYNRRLTNLDNNPSEKKIICNGLEINLCLQAY